MNSTTISELILLGFPNLNPYKLPFFSIILSMYCLTICENLLIMFLVSTSQRLHSPMYFFLGHLALSDMIIVTSVVPKMLGVIIREGSVISFVECFTQFYLYGGAACSECFLLTAMSYDRYLAICKPLHYTAMMSVHLRYSLVISSWLLGFMFVLVTLVLVSDLDFCGPNVINHFFCDLSPLLELSCSDTTAVDIDIFIHSVLISLLPFLFIIITYVHIFIIIFGISSISGRQKTFSTCSSHLAVVSTYYGSTLMIYMVPHRGHSLTVNKVISLVYIVLTPFLNPLIYSLRNKDLQSSMSIYLTACLRKVSCSKRDRQGPSKNLI